MHATLRYADNSKLYLRGVYFPAVREMRKQLFAALAYEIEIPGDAIISLGRVQSTHVLLLASGKN